jgi:hypothetical protein
VRGSPRVCPKRALQGNRLEGQTPTATDATHRDGQKPIATDEHPPQPMPITHRNGKMPTAMDYTLKHKQLQDFSKKLESAQKCHFSDPCKPLIPSTNFLSNSTQILTIFLPNFTSVELDTTLAKIK